MDNIQQYRVVRRGKRAPATNVTLGSPKPLGLPGVFIFGRNGERKIRATNNDALIGRPGDPDLAVLQPALEAVLTAA